VLLPTWLLIFVILDIEMPDINGFHVARVLQNKYPEIHLAFISNHDNYVFDEFLDK